MSSIEEERIALNPDDFVRNLVTELELDYCEVSLESHLVNDLGFDSLQMVEAAVLISEMAELTIDDDDWYAIDFSQSTVRDLYMFYLMRSGPPIRGTDETNHDGSLGLKGLLIRLRAPSASDYPKLYDITINEEIAWRWRYGGTIPSFDDFVRTFASGVFTQFVITKPRETQAIGITVAYSANFQSQTCYMATVVAPEFTGSGAGEKQQLCSCNTCFAHGLSERCTWNFQSSI